jgi:hypothetical protein
MFRSRIVDDPLLLGIVAGLTFGAVNLFVTWVEPLADDSPWTLLPFYGSMFMVWSLAAFRATRRSGRVWSGVTAGTSVACATFSMFSVLVLLRVNVFLNDLAGRADWRNMILRFRASDVDSLRLFVNLEYIKGAPFKIGVASAIGAVLGVIGGAVGRLMFRPTVGSAT